MEEKDNARSGETTELMIAIVWVGDKKKLQLFRVSAGEIEK